MVEALNILGSLSFSEFKSTFFLLGDTNLQGSVGEGIGYPLQYSWASLVAQLVKNTLAMWETGVPPLGWEDPLKKGKAIHSCILAWRIPWTTVAKSQTG